jgi:hypothetical protein
VDLTVGFGNVNARGSMTISRPTGGQWRIGVAAIAVPGLIAWAYVALVRDGNVTGPPPAAAKRAVETPPPSAPGLGLASAPPAAEAPLVSTETLLKQAVERAGDADMRAWRELDPAPLAGAYADEELTRRMEMVADLRRDGLYGVARREDVWYGEIVVSPDGKTATVRATAVWETKFHSTADGRCVGWWPPTEIPQTLHLAERGGAWVVTNIDFHTAGPTETPCT